MPEGRFVENDRLALKKIYIYSSEWNDALFTHWFDFFFPVLSNLLASKLFFDFLLHLTMVLVDVFSF